MVVKDLKVYQDQMGQKDRKDYQCQELLDLLVPKVGHCKPMK